MQKREDVILALAGLRLLLNSCGVAQLGVGGG